MAKYLIDANLPYHFILWNKPDIVHVRDLDDTWSDELIWEYAKQNNFIIVTKDSDFSIKVLHKGTPPKVIHLKFGNLKMKDFHSKLYSIWGEIEKSIEENSMVNVYLDRIEAIK